MKDASGKGTGRMWRVGVLALAACLRWLILAQAADLVQTGQPMSEAFPPSVAQKRDGPAKAQGQMAYVRLPLSFEVNQGQTDSKVKFLARGSGYTLFLTSTEAVLVLHQRQAAAQNMPPHPRPLPQGERDAVRDFASDKGSATVLRMKLVGANPNPQVTGMEELPGKVNYFLSNDPTKWQTNIPTYAKVQYTSIYPGIDLIYYGTQRQLEYDVIVAPGADPTAIRLAFHGAETVEIDAQGDLLVHIGSGKLRLHKPRFYQEIDGVKHEISGSYVLLPPTPNPQAPTPQVGVHVAAYDPTKPLIIDPVLSYSTYLGGSGSDEAAAIAVDSAGNAYITGDTSIPYPGWPCDFPTTPGAFDRTCRMTASFVTKLNPAGSTLIYSTFLGGSTSQSASGIAVDRAGNAYVTGEAYSGFPTTPGAFQPTFGGGSIYGGDAFVTKLNPDGSALIYSTYLGGSDGDRGSGIAVDSAGNAYVTGITYSTDFPTTPAAFAPTYNGGMDAFVTKLNPTGSALVYSTFLGGISSDYSWAIAVDATGHAYVTGGAGCDFPTTPGAYQRVCRQGDAWYDAFVTKLNPTGSALVYSTFLGGGHYDNGRGITVDSSGNTYVTGDTQSADFPTTSGAFDPTYGGGQDAFATKVNPTGSALVYSTFLGGPAGEFGWAIAVDAAGNAYVTGETGSADFPTTPDAFQPSFGGVCDAFFTTLNPDGSALAYSTFLGGSTCDRASGIAVDGAGNAYVTGGAGPGFPTTQGAFQHTYRGAGDAFVAKISVESQEALLGWPFIESTGWAMTGFGTGDCKGVDGTAEGDHCGDDWYAQDWNFGFGNDDLGKVLLSATSGQVIFSESWDGYGEEVIIQLNRPFENFALRYTHLQEVWVAEGDEVCLGSPVGVVGFTGLTGTGQNTSHLHAVFYQKINEISARRNRGETGLFWLEQGQPVESIKRGTPPTKFAAPFAFDPTIQGAGCEEAFALAGRVTTLSGQAVPNVVLKLAGPVLMETTPFVKRMGQKVGGGNYAFHRLPNGTYTVTPERKGYIFNPPSWTVTIAGGHISSVDFVAIPLRPR